MSRDPRSLQALARVTEATYQTAAAAMAALAAEEAAIRRALDALSPPSHDLTSVDLDPAARAGAHLKWQLWAAARREALLAELARLRVRQEAARDVLARAFGRNMVAGRLIERAKAEHARQAARAAVRDPDA